MFQAATKVLKFQMLQ